ncbi:MAG: VWA domain-containing protein, partial [Thermoanaerobaculia bacterium]
MILLTNGAAFGAPVVWLPLPDALKQAAAERKVVVVDFRGPCTADDPGCANADRFMVESATHVPILRAYSSFVLARADAASSGNPQEVQRLLDQKAPTPSFALVDPDGTLIATWARFEDSSSHLHFLNLSRDQVPLILRAQAARQRGAAAESDLLLAEVDMRLLNVSRARERFAAAAAAFRAAQDMEHAGKADIAVQVANYYLGLKNAAIKAIRESIAKGSPRVAAHGYLALGRLYLIAREVDQALLSFRKALDVAPRGSSESNEARSALGAMGQTSVVGSSGLQGTIQIVSSPKTTLTGRSEFSAAVKPGIEKVIWYLDSEQVAWSAKAPFTATLNLGQTPRLHVVEAVAVDGLSRPVAKATARINDRIDEPRVSIMAPVAGNITGAADLEADVYVPPGRKLETVQFFWNGTEIATFSKPPYRHAFQVSGTFAYFQVKATFDDGTDADDSTIVNSTGFAESMEVRTLVFPATVVGSDGKRVNGLKANDFMAFDESLPVALTVRDSDDEPMTIGIALDMSSSMTTLLVPVMDMASRMISAIAPEGKVFIVAFNEQPHLIHPPSINADSLRAKVFDQYASGGTALADALSFSIQQFTALPGKKALVVITDGNEGSSDQNAKACESMARESGVPIYVIVPRESGDIENAVGFRDVLRKVSNVTGGLFFSRPAANDQKAIFSRIREEVRGQY